MTLAIWTVYRHPSDYPDKFVARRFDIDGDGARPTASIITAPNLETLRDILEFELLLTRLDRHPVDEPQIVECWL
jgi:hypothetical protein